MEAFSEEYLLISILIMGLIIGSFLNTIIYRLPIINGLVETRSKFKKFNLVAPRSHCDNCSYRIPFYLNIPVVSYIALKGKCFNCGHKIPSQYPLVEILTGVLFAWLFVSFGFSLELLSLLLLASLLITVSFIDLKHFVLPNEITLTLIISGLLINMWISIIPITDSIVGCVVGYSLFFLIEKGFYLWKGVEGLGRGDAKLLAGIGSWLGWVNLPFIILLAAMTGIIIYGVFALQKRKGLKKFLGTKIPLGPLVSFATLFLLPFLI